MNQKLDIVCKDLFLEFPIFNHSARSLRAQVLGNAKKINSFVALDDLNLDVKQGERVALLGRNGAGKSTLLKTLAGIYAPKNGTVELSSTPTSIFGVAVGIDEAATGYENIPLLMASRNIPQKNIDAVTNDVENFTELGEALNRPISTYSSGMRLRIAFAIATFENCDILLMDEVIGVGDSDFRKKSQKRLQDMMHNAGTMVLASHANPLLKEHCERGIVLNKGKIVFDGAIEEAINFYENQ